MSIFKLPKQLKPIPPDVHIDTVGEFDIFRKGELYIVEQPSHPLKTGTRSTFRTLLEAYIYAKNWQGIPYEPITFHLSPTAYEEKRRKAGKQVMNWLQTRWQYLAEPPISRMEAHQV